MGKDIDTPAAPLPSTGWQPGPVARTATFLCGRCVQTRSVPGRKLRRVLGLRTWVCACCVAAVGQKPA